MQESSSDRENELAGLQNELAGLRQSLVSVQEDLRSANSAREEQRNSAIVANYQLGAFLCSSIAKQNMDLDRLTRLLADTKKMCDKGSDSKLCSEDQLDGFGRKRAASKGVLDGLVNYYRSTLKVTVGNYDLPVISSQKDRALLYISKMQNGNLSEFAETYFTHLNAAYKGAGDADDRWISDCSSVRRK